MNALNNLVNELLNSMGSFALVGILVIVFAETGLLIGFFLPGDSLLLIAGAVAAGKPEKASPGTTPLDVHMPLTALLIGAPICAIIGAQLGHYLGATFGARMLARPDSRLFKRKHVERAEYHFQKFGPAKAVFLARFIPIVRTFLNPVAGALEMPAKRFFAVNVVGGVVWTIGVVMIGYSVGSAIDIDAYIIPATVVIVLLSLIPVVLEVRRNRRERREDADADASGGRHAATKASGQGAVGQAPQGYSSVAETEWSRYPE